MTTLGHVYVKTPMGPYRVPCEIVGPFAIHASLGRHVPGLSVTLTHRPTGLLIRRLHSRQLARSLCTALQQCAIDVGVPDAWDTAEGYLTPALREQAGRLINYMAPLATT